MQKILMGVGVLLIVLGIFGASYTWHHDHREAETLDKYAATDFQVGRDGDGNWESATLSLWDYRYDNARLLNKAIVFTDGAPWEIDAVTKQTRKGWRNENKLFLHFPKFFMTTGSRLTCRSAKKICWLGKGNYVGSRFFILSLIK